MVRLTEVVYYWRTDSEADIKWRTDGQTDIKWRTDSETGGTLAALGGGGA